LYWLAKAASRYQAGPPPGQMFRKAVRQEGLEPAAQDSNPEEMTHRGVVSYICSLVLYSEVLQNKLHMPIRPMWVPGTVVLKWAQYVSWRIA